MAARVPRPMLKINLTCYVVKIGSQRTGGGLVGGLAMGATARTGTCVTGRRAVAGWLIWFDSELGAWGTLQSPDLADQDLAAAPKFIG